MVAKKRKKRWKVVAETPFSRATTSYGNKKDAREAAKAMRAGFKSLPKSTRKGVSVRLEEDKYS